MGVDALIEDIAAACEADEDEIREEVEEKLEEMGGIVSEEGAAHLVARAYGVELASAEEQELSVDNVVPGMNRVDLTAKVLDISDINTFEQDDGEGKVRNVVLGDESGTLRMTLWNEQVDIGEKLDEDDVISISGAYSKEDNRGNVELRVGDSTTIELADEEVDAVPYHAGGDGGGGGGAAQDAPISAVQDEGVTYRVTGTLIELYTDDPFYDACPECRKKVDEDGTCEEHGDVDAEPTLILSAILDDGYGNIRAVFFRDRAKAVLEAEDVDFDGDADTVTEYADAVKGKEVTVTGRARYNDFFDRMELMGNDVDTAAIPELIDDTLAQVTADE